LPKPNQTIEIIKFLKHHKIKVLFTQKEFSQKSADVIAKEINAKVTSISVLAPDYFENLVKFAQILHEGFSQ